MASSDSISCVPCFFGPVASGTSDQLYGVYTPPAVSKVGTPCDLGIVFCAPWGEEYLESHSLLSQLAAQLGDRGIPSLRFDFRGVGNSRGTATFRNWSADINAAEAELKSRCGLERIAFFGMGLGAAIAYRSKAEDSECPLLILLNPVLNGDHHLELLRERDETLRRSIRKAPPRIQSESEEELCGFVAGKELITNVQFLDLLGDPPSVVPALVLISTSLAPEYDRFVSNHRVRSAAVRREHFDTGDLNSHLLEVIEDEVIS